MINPTQKTEQLKDVPIGKLVKSLSSISKVQTKQIRKEIQKSTKHKNKKRIQYTVESDKLLKDQRILRLPNLMFTYKLFVDKNKGIGNLNDKSIDSKAYIKRANFQFRKIQLRKQSMARKHHRSEERYKVNPQTDYNLTSRIDLNKITASNVFENVLKTDSQQLNSALMNRIKTTVHSSRKELKKLYQSHCKTVRQTFKSNHIVNSNNQLQSSETTPRTKKTQPIEDSSITKQNTFVKSKEITQNQKSLIELIKLSLARSKNSDRKDTELTRKQEIEMAASKALIAELQSDIDVNNRLKQSLVFGHLKKLLYGDRKGRFIQDNTFRTRLKGECSEQYMNVVQQQEHILSSFNGSFLNRRNLVQKFSAILGTLRKADKVHESEIAVQQFSLF